MTPPQTRSAARSASRRGGVGAKKYISLAICAVVLMGIAAALVVVQPWVKQSIQPNHSEQYLGVFEPDAPQSYAGVDNFAEAIGRQPNVVPYYSFWNEPFQVSFASAAAKHGATTLVQLDPTTGFKAISLASIAAGAYDSYLRSYAAAVRAFRTKVIISFGHEMNGNWYSWGNQQTSPKSFVAAWRHIVSVFRGVGAENVTWLWTVNIINKTVPIPAPGPWWPGSSYVNWVGVDGYYYSPSSTFASVFGPTIVAVRALTSDPIIITETGAAQAAGQPAKIGDLFSGIQAYGLLGFVWFDKNDVHQGLNWRLTDPAAFAAFRQDAKIFMKPLKATPRHPSPSAPPS
jgi:mannan endo-1,4-beta-mannosidase